MMYRALVMDLDGTAVALGSTGEDVRPETKNLIKQAQARGCHVTAASGRSWEFAKPVIQVLGLESPCIVEGGTKIIQPSDEKSLWEKYLDDQAATAAFEMLKRQTADTLLAFAGKKNVSIAHPVPLSSISNIPSGVRVLYFLQMPSEIAQDCANAINAEGYAAAHVTPSWYGDFLDLHVTDTEGTKEYALAAWHELVHVSMAETIAMGDSANDIPLFQSASLKIAVGNATSELKSLADYIAPAQADGALDHVIEKFLFK